MTINEIFTKPTVKTVIFQIKFPNLFYMEKSIGDLQLRIMKEFPKSAMLFRRQILLADLGPEGKLPEFSADEKESLNKIWQFESEQGFRLNILTNSLDITSEYHKSYDLEGGPKFRDAIQFVLNNFFEVTKIPVLNRIGLRYIDDCPLPKKMTSTSFRRYYNTAFRLDRFNIADAKEMAFVTTVKRGDYQMRYAETLQIAENKNRLILDFDGFATDIDSDQYLTVTDALHRIISGEYEATIKGPVYTYMRQRKE